MNTINSLIAAVVMNLFVSCDTDRINDCVNVGTSTIVSWKNDSLGCNGDRRKLIDSHDINPDDFIGKKISCLYKTLGQPNYKSEKDGSMEIYYYVSCAIAPPAFPTNAIRHDRINTEATRMYVEYSAEGIVQLVHIAVP